MSSSFVLIGPKHSGKSALLEAFSGAYVAGFDYPGTGVRLAEGTVWMESRWARVVDTPGVTSLLFPAEAERVTRDLLLAMPGAAALVVADAGNLVPPLALVIELAELGVPLALCLNKADQSAAAGQATDEAALARRLGVPVVSTVAVRSERIADLRSALARAAVPTVRADYGPRVEAATASVVRAIGDGRRARGLALLLLAGDETAHPWIQVRARAAALVHVADMAAALTRETGLLASVITEARGNAAARLARSVQTATIRSRLARLPAVVARAITRLAGSPRS